MSEKFKINVDGKICEISLIENNEGIEIKSKGPSCKKLFGKDYFKKIKLDYIS